MFALTPLDVGKAHLDAADGVALLTLDQLHQLSLALADSLVELVQRAPALGSVCVELGRSGLHRLLHCARDFVAKTNEPGALLLALAFEPLGVRRDPRLGVRDQLLLAMCKLRQLVGHSVLRSLEIVAPGVEAGLHLLLRRREGLAELVGGCVRALERGSPALLADTALLLLEHRHGVSACARERSLELGAPLFRFARDLRVQPRLGACELLVDPA